MPTPSPIPALSVSWSQVASGQTRYTVKRGSKILFVVDEHDIANHPPFYRLQTEGETFDEAQMEAFKQVIVNAYGDEGWFAFKEQMLESSRMGRFTLETLARVFKSERMLVRRTVVMPGLELGIFTQYATSWMFRSAADMNMQDEMRIYFRNKDRAMQCPTCYKHLTEEEEQEVKSRVPQSDMTHQEMMFARMDVLKEEQETIRQVVEEQKIQKPARKKKGGGK